MCLPVHVTENAKIKEDLRNIQCYCNIHNGLARAYYFCQYIYNNIAHIGLVEIVDAARKYVSCEGFFCVVMRCSVVSYAAAYGIAEFPQIVFTNY